ncbi:MAG TPA: hypothetical protein VF070_44545 [Streptosporangiaceae bacterium]
MRGGRDVLDGLVRRAERGWLAGHGTRVGQFPGRDRAVLRLFPASRPGPGTPLPPGSEQDAGVLLDQRLAAGEIGADDYLRLRGTLHAQR